jgi:hypothetical protein
MIHRRSPLAGSGERTLNSGSSAHEMSCDRKWFDLIAAEERFRFAMTRQ